MMTNVTIILFEEMIGPHATPRAAWCCWSTRRGFVPAAHAVADGTRPFARRDERGG